jgi:hypothetical protein
LRNRGLLASKKNYPHQIVSHCFSNSRIDYLIFSREDKKGKFHLGVHLPWVEAGNQTIVPIHKIILMLLSEIT